MEDDCSFALPYVGGAKDSELTILLIILYFQTNLNRERLVLLRHLDVLVRK